MSTIALRSVGLSKRYRNTWALRDCSFSLPSGSVAALVGANGAGKTTLLNIISGLAQPNAGEVVVAEPPRHIGLTDTNLRSRVSLVAQHKPLYSSFTVADMLRFGSCVNAVWDQERAESWLKHFEVPLDRRCGRLSGGQQAQVALALAVGARPALMLLDEPLANLDPLVRSEVIKKLLVTIAETEATLVLSTHVIADLNGIADHVLLLAGGRLMLQGKLDELLAAHAYRVGPRAAAPPGNDDVIESSHTERQSTFLVKVSDETAPLRLGANEQWTSRRVPLEDLVLAYLRRSKRTTAAHVSAPTNGKGTSHD